MTRFALLMSPQMLNVYPESGKRDSSASPNALDAEITIGGEEVDSQASGLFEETKRTAEQALKDGFGFRKAIDDLESFSTSEDYSARALDIDGQGRLVIETEEGVTCLNYGEVSLKLSKQETDR